MQEGYLRAGVELQDMLEAVNQLMRQEMIGKWWMVWVLLNIHLSSLGGVRIEFLEQFWGMEIFSVNPQVIGFGIPFSMYEILELGSVSFPSRLDDQFDFIFLLSVIDHWWGSCKRCAIGFCLLIWKEKVNVENVVDSHGIWQV